MNGAVPPLGAVVHGDVRERSRRSGNRYMARARWTHPVTSHREEVNQTFTSREAAESWLELQRQTAATGIDHGQTLATYVEGLGSGGRGRSTRHRRATRTQLAYGCVSCRHWAICRSGC
jgi:hypothetical protein